MMIRSCRSHVRLNFGKSGSGMSNSVEFGMTSTISFILGLGLGLWFRHPVLFGSCARFKIQNRSKSFVLPVSVLCVISIGSACFKQPKEHADSR